MTAQSMVSLVIPWSSLLASQLCIVKNWPCPPTPPLPQTPQTTGSKSAQLGGSHPGQVGCVLKAALPAGLGPWLSSLFPPSTPLTPTLPF